MSEQQFIYLPWFLGLLENKEKPYLCSRTQDVNPIIAIATVTQVSMDVITTFPLLALAPWTEEEQTATNSTNPINVYDSQGAQARTGTAAVTCIALCKNACISKI